jgi:hypothetical protein
LRTYNKGKELDFYPGSLFIFLKNVLNLLIMKFNIGDVVVRTEGDHGGMKVGNVSRVSGLNYSGTGVKLTDYCSINNIVHDASCFSYGHRRRKNSLF